MTSLQVKKDIIYGNYSIYHPDGTLMCHTDRKKINWYIKKDLAYWVDENAIQLKFEPKGRGNVGDSEYYAEARENKCVVCGCTDNLTLHHVVPYQYRKHFPVQYKSHTSFDVLPVCVKHHDEYECEATKLNKHLQIQYKALPALNKLPPDVEEAKEVAGLISTLLRNGDKIPQERKGVLLEKIRKYFKDDDIWWDDLPELFVDVNYKVESSSPAKTIVESLDNILPFIVMWRKHFVSIMNPQHLSPKWLADMEKVER